MCRRSIQGPGAINMGVWLSWLALLQLSGSVRVSHGYDNAGFDGWYQPVPHRPVDIITDVINDLGVRILQQYTSHGNVAFSPTGVAFVLAALYEGSAGRGRQQIADALGLPRDRDITRIGFRDIHRRLRTYLNADGFLGGLTLNQENTKLRPEYEDILRFYGFDLTVPDEGTNDTATVLPVQSSGTSTEFLSTASVMETIGTTLSSMETSSRITRTTPASAVLITDASMAAKDTGSLSTSAPPLFSDSTIVSSTISPTIFPTASASEGSPAMGQSTAPVVDSMSRSTPSIVDPTVQSSTVQSTIVQSSTDQTSTFQPSSDQPSTLQRSSDQSSTVQPATVQASTDQASTLRPSSDQSSNVQPSSDQSSTVQSSTVQASTLQPSSDQSSNVQPPTIQYSTVQPSTIQSLTVQPSTLQTSTDQASTLQPSSAQSSTVQPSTAQSSTVQPSSAQSSPVQPSSAQSSTVQPSSGQPSSVQLSSAQSSPVQPSTVQSTFVQASGDQSSTLQPSSAQSPTVRSSMETGATAPTTVPSISTTVSTPASPGSGTPTSAPMEASTFPGPATESSAADSVPGATELISESTTAPTLTMTDASIVPEASTDPPGTNEDSASTGGPPADANTVSTEPANNRSIPGEPGSGDLSVTTVATGGETGSPAGESAAAGGAMNRRKRDARSPRGFFSSYPDEGIWMQDLGIWKPYSPILNEASVRDSTEISFLVNGCDVSSVTASRYFAVLPFAYFPSLHAVALEFPLDDPRYNILLMMATDRRDTYKLARDLGGKSLRLLRKQLQATWVRATIPSFMLRGFVTLTSFLQRLGILDAFEPRSADLSPMTPDLGVYARDVQQSIGVNIRNYMKPDRTHSRNGLFERAGPVPFTVVHPFLYFIVDAETSVALIAGRVNDPLNSRIL